MGRGHDICMCVSEVSIEVLSARFSDGKERMCPQQKWLVCCRCQTLFLMPMCMVSQCQVGLFPVIQNKLHAIVSSYVKCSYVCETSLFGDKLGSLQAPKFHGLKAFSFLTYIIASNTDRMGPSCQWTNTMLDAKQLLNAFIYCYSLLSSRLTVGTKKLTCRYKGINM